MTADLSHDQGAPDPVAPFSHAVEADGWVFVTGQMPFTGTSATSPYPEGIEAQTRQVMENLKRVLAGCELGLENVVAARVFLTHFEQDYEAMNRVYAGYFAAGQAAGAHLRRRDARSRAARWWRSTLSPAAFRAGAGELADEPSSSRGSYGLATWCSKPAARACARSTVRVSPVTAISAGRALP